MPENYSFEYSSAKREYIFNPSVMMALHSDLLRKR